MFYLTNFYFQTTENCRFTIATFNVFLNTSAKVFAMTSMVTGVNIIALIFVLTQEHYMHPPMVSYTEKICIYCKLFNSFSKKKINLNIIGIFDKRKDKYVINKQKID